MPKSINQQSSPDRVSAETSPPKQPSANQQPTGQPNPQAENQPPKQRHQTQAPKPKQPSAPQGWRVAHDVFVQACARRGEDARSTALLLEAQYPETGPMRQEWTDWIGERMRVGSREAK